MEDRWREGEGWVGWRIFGREERQKNEEGREGKRKRRHWKGKRK